MDVEDKSLRVQRFQRATVHSAVQIMSSMGLRGPEGLRPHMLCRRTTPVSVRSYAELYEWLEPGQLLAEPPPRWARDWEAADPDRFTM